MKKVCAMAGIIFNPEKPGQSIHELKSAGMEEVMFDFGMFASVEWILRERQQEKSKWKPQRTKEFYQKVAAQFLSHDFMPTIARLPFMDVSVRMQDIFSNRKRTYSDPSSPQRESHTQDCAILAQELIDLTMQVNKDCIRACEEIGCENIIVQPLSVGLERGQEWEGNKAFLQELASCCKKEGTRLLLCNQCYDKNGHLIRGVCSDGEQAASWIDALNKEAGMERFGFCLDIGVCNLCGQNIQRMTSALDHRIQAVILTENDGQKNAKLLPFTSAYGRRSTLDWLSVLRGLREISYDGYLILETVDTTVAFSPLLQPYLFPVYKAVLDYFEMQIQIERDLKKYEHIALFGAGNMCRNYMKCYGEKYPPLFTCDNNPKLWGTEFEGLKIKSPEALRNLPQDCGVIICNIFYREIEAQLRSMGITNIGYFNDEYMPSFYFDRLKREEDSEENDFSKKEQK